MELDIEQDMVVFFKRSVKANKATGVTSEFKGESEIIILEGAGFKDQQAVIAETRDTQKNLSPPPPIVNSIDPTSGPSVGGTTVAIHGDRFLPGCTVNYDGTPEAPGGTFTSPQLIHSITPAHVAGFVDVEVENLPGLADALVNAYKFIDAPTISSVSPSKGAGSGGSFVTINGNHFDFPSGYTVTFDTHIVSATRLSQTQLRCQVPSHSTGAGGSVLVPVNIKVTAPDGQTGTRVNGYNYYGGFRTIVGPLVITQGLNFNYTFESLDDTSHGPDPTFNRNELIIVTAQTGMASVGIGPNPVPCAAGSGNFQMAGALSGPGSGSFTVTADDVLGLAPLITVTVNH